MRNKKKTRAILLLGRAISWFIFFKPGGAKGNRRKDNPGKQFLQLIALYILKTKSGIEKAKRNYLETSIINSLY